MLLISVVTGTTNCDWTATSKGTGQPLGCHRTVRPGNRHAVVIVKEIGRFRESRLTSPAKELLVAMLEIGSTTPELAFPAK